MAPPQSPATVISLAIQTALALGLTKSADVALHVQHELELAGYVIARKPQRKGHD